MTIFEVSKDDLLRLDDGQLEECVARLCEAEAAAAGGNAGDVRRGGAGDAPDGGVDIRVALSADRFDSGFLPRKDTIFQVKKYKMPRAKIKKEMRPKDALRKKISEQAAKKGAYVIVSLQDDCAEPALDDRRKAMRDAVGGNPNGSDLHVDFYDLSKLHQWLRQHPTIVLWVRDTIPGIQLSGWRPHGTWSAVPAGHEDELILAPGVDVILPSPSSRPLSLRNAIDPCRELIRTSGKAIRIVGLSGVGKTRFVQALFEENVGTNALDRSSAIYADTGHDLEPSAETMLDQLIAEGRSAVLVVDNCASSLHADLSQKFARENSKVRLVTIEYDIQEDQPQTTEVIRIEATGPEIARTLLERRYPVLGHVNAHRIAGRVAGGNARIALAVAEQVAAGRTPSAELSDNELFDRLFWQRSKLDENFRRHAEALSLVSYFSIKKDKEEGSELSALGSLCGADYAQIYRSISTLVERQIAQERDHWRAVLPQAIANRLARDALNKISDETLRSTFEACKNARLLKSFAQRLECIPEHPVARKIVPPWFADGGPLANIDNPNDNEAELLRSAASVAPEAALDKIEATITADGFDGWKDGHSEGRETIMNLLTVFADEADNADNANDFDRCVRLLLNVFDLENPNDESAKVKDRIRHLFQPYASGIHRTIGRREDILRQVLWSKDSKRRDLGQTMLLAAFDGSRVVFNDSDEFGAQSQDVADNLEFQRYNEWRTRFIELARQAALDPDTDIADMARFVLSLRFSQLWPGESVQEKPIREKLIETAIAVNEQRPWPEGFWAVCQAIQFEMIRPDNKKKRISPELADLKKRLAPTDLLSRIGTYAFGNYYNVGDLCEEFDDAGKRRHYEKLEALAESLGDEFAKSGLPLSALAEDLLSPGDAPYASTFGKGFAKASPDIPGIWKELVAFLKKEESQNIDILAGFVRGAKETDPRIAARILDDAMGDPFLRRFLARLHPARSFDETDLDRCMKALPHHDADFRPYGGLKPYGDLFWRVECSGLPRDKMIKLAQMLLERKGGACELVYAFSMRLRDADPEADILGGEFRKLGLAAVAQMLREDRKSYDDTIYPDCVVRAVLKFSGNESERAELLDAVFAKTDIDIDTGTLSRNTFYRTALIVAQAMPEEFLERDVRRDAKDRIMRMNFFEGRLFALFPLAGIVPLELNSETTLMGWCRKKDDPNIWNSVAEMLIPFEGDTAERQPRLSKAAVELLRAAPDSVAVLRIFARSINSGSADTMERRAKAFEPFLTDPDTEISSAARVILEKARKRIKVAREYEREREQRFE